MGFTWVRSSKIDAFAVDPQPGSVTILETGNTSAGSRIENLLAAPNDAPVEDWQLLKELAGTQGVPNESGLFTDIAFPSSDGTRIDIAIGWTGTPEEWALWSGAQWQIKHSQQSEPDEIFLVSCYPDQKMCLGSITGLEPGHAVGDYEITATILP